MGIAKSGVIPFCTAAMNRDDEDDLPEPDSLLWSAYCARAVANPQIRADPVSAMPQVYGLSCAFYMLIPGAYYIAGYYPNDFEKAVLTAVNSGGQNLARASLTGGLVGAMTGLSGIPERFIKGLVDGDRWVSFAKEIAHSGTK